MRKSNPIPARSPRGRARGAFTLVELLVVVAIIALLVAILVPQLAIARSLAKQALCQHNLKQISEALNARNQDITLAAKYPSGDDWPGIPYELCPNKGVFVCPEDTPGEYNPLVSWIVTTEYGPTGYYQTSPITRFTIYMDPPSFGCDKRIKAGYIEYAFEDGPGIVTNPASWGYDGTFCVYDLAGGGKKIVLTYRTCGQDNRAFMFGKPLFPEYGDVRFTQIPEGTYRIVAGVYTSYGINNQVNRVQVSPDTIVLADYWTKEGMIIDLSAFPPTEAAQKLKDGARHRGKCNILRADDSVGVAGPMAIDPRLYPDPWTP